MARRISAISGASGFIGKHLTDRLRANNHKVAWIQRDLLVDPIALEEWMRKAHPDYVWHLAAYGNHYHQQDEQEIVATNVIKTMLLQSALKDIPIKQFFNFSTSSVYGKDAAQMVENASLLTDTYYGASKVAAEYITFAWRERYNKNIVNVRPFSVYGEGEADFRFIPTVIKCLLGGDELTLDPTPVHDWIYIDDFIDGLFKLLDMPPIRAVNIGTGRQYSNLEVVKTLEKIAGKKVKIKNKSGLRDYDTAKWVSENGLLNLMQWKPKHSLEEGLRRTYEYYKQKAKK